MGENLPSAVMRMKEKLVNHVTAGISQVKCVDKI
jgi:hypothetical protein